MVFKISNEKFDKSPDLEEKGLTFPKINFPPLNLEEDEVDVFEKYRVLSKSDKDLERKLVLGEKIGVAICCMFLYAVVMAFFISKMPFKDMSKNKSVAVGSCLFNNRSGSCMAQEFCCEGEYVINSKMCSPKHVCCMGAAKKCKDKKSPDFWSFESIPRISSKVVSKNVNQSVVDQAIVTSVLALEKRTHFYEMSDKIGTDMTALTGQKWFSIVGNLNSFDLTLSRVSAYILISINDMKVLLIRVNNNVSPLPSFVKELKIDK